MSQQSLTLPVTGPGSGAGSAKARRNRRLLELAGAAAIAATYVFLVLTQPADIANGPSSFAALVALGGFFLGAVLLIAAALPVLPTSTLVLMPVALVLNVVLGQLMGTTGLPFYLDRHRHRADRSPRRPGRGCRHGRPQHASCGPSSTRPCCPSPPERR